MNKLKIMDFPIKKRGGVDLIYDLVEENLLKNKIKMCGLPQACSSFHMNYSIRGRPTKRSLLLTRLYNLSFEWKVEGIFRL